MACTCCFAKGYSGEFDYIVWSACAEAKAAASQSDDFAQHIAAAVRRIDAEDAEEAFASDLEIREAALDIAYRAWGNYGDGLKHAKMIETYLRTGN